MKLLHISVTLFICVTAVICFKNGPSIVIIGAGPAGIAAASRLLEKGFRNLKILEAEPRIGGRVHSVKFGDAFLDLGAQWCHGETDNVVYGLVKNLNILRHTNTSNKLYHSSGTPINEKLSSEILDIIDSIYSADGNRKVADSLTVGDYCIQNFNRTLQKKYSNDRRKLELALMTTEYFEHRVLGSEGSFSWFEPAAKSSYRDCPGDLLLNWNGLGYKTILEVLMKKYPDPKKQLPIDNKILLNKEVKQIRWNEKMRNRAVTVSCTDGTNYIADHVIFTPSVGVLKERSQSMFQPRLPEVKNRAIGQVGFGAVIKVAMHFPNHWWGKEFGFNFVWSKEDELSVLKDRPSDPHWNGKSWVTYLFAIETAENNPNVLIAWITGNFVPVIESLSEDKLIDGIDYVLKRFLGRKFQTSKPDKIQRSQWYSNPHFRGVYSFQTVEGKRGNRATPNDILAAPLVNFQKMPIVQFAGEATHPYYYSTVHGAIETGFREADALAKLYLKNL